MKYHSKIRRVNILYLLSCILLSGFLFAGEEWDAAFQEAEAAFNSRNQSSCVPLFQELAGRINAEMSKRQLTGDESTLLQRSYDYLGQSFFNRNQMDQARSTFLKLIEINPDYMMNEDLVSIKVIELFGQLKKQNRVSSVSIHSLPVGARVRIDGRVLGNTDIAGARISIGDHSIEVSKAGYEGQTRSLTVTAGSPQDLQFELKPDPQTERLYADAMIRFGVMDAAGARSGLEKSLAVNPDDAVARSALAEVLQMQGYETQAQEEAAKAGEAMKDHPLIEGRYWQTMFDWEKAVQSYVAAFGTGQLEDGLRLGYALVHEGRGKDALDVVGKLRAKSQDPRISLLESQAQETLGDFTQQRKAASSAAGKAMALGLQLIVAEARLQEGRALLNLGEWNDAGSVLQEAKGLFSTSGDSFGSARVELCLADLLFAQKNQAAALDKYLSAIKYFNDIGNKSTAAWAQYGEGRVLRRQNNSVADAKLRGVLDLARETNDRRLTALVLIENVTKDRKPLEDALAVFRDMGDKQNTARALIRLGDIQFDNRAALEQYREAAQLFRDGGNSLDLAQTLLKMGNIQQRMNNPTDGRKSFEEALPLMRASGDSHSIADTLFALGQAMRQLGDKDGAGKELQEALDLYDKAGDSIAMQKVKDALNGIFGEKENNLIALLQAGFDALNRDDYATAEEKYSEARTIAKELGDSASEANALISLGYIYSKEKKDAEAIELWNDAVKAARQAGDKPKLALGLYSLSVATYNLGDEIEANNLYDQSATVYREIGLKPRPRPW